MNDMMCPKSAALLVESCSSFIFYHSGSHFRLHLSHFIFSISLLNLSLSSSKHTLALLNSFVYAKIAVLSLSITRCHFSHMSRVCQHLPSAFAKIAVHLHCSPTQRSFWVSTVFRSGILILPFLYAKIAVLSFCYCSLRTLTRSQQKTHKLTIFYTQSLLPCSYRGSLYQRLITMFVLKRKRRRQWIGLMYYRVV
jgi:hypothetical protein